MIWYEIAIDTTPEGIESLSNKLIIMGLDQFSIEYEQDFSEFESESMSNWGKVDEELIAGMLGKSRICLYCQENLNEYLSRLEAGLDELRASCPETGEMKLGVRKVAQEDWENSWKQYYKSFQVGDGFVIRPEWEPKVEDSDRIELVLDPGMIFGTGDHATTRLCLLELEKRVKGGERVLDLGCGSGILSAAALLLGAEHAVGVDIDPIAETIARKNLELNGFYGDRFTAMTGNVLAGDVKGSFDIVIANIVADVIIALAPSVNSLLSIGGVFICSGILDSRVDEVIAALKEAGLMPEESKLDSGWGLISAKPVD